MGTFVPRAMTDVWFDIDPTRTRPETEIPIPEEIAALPEALGSGNVRSLRETMALDTSGKLRDEEQRRAA